MRLILAAALMLCAWWCYQRSVALIDKASGHIPTKEEAPDGDFDFFDQKNPIKDPPAPEELRAVRVAQWVQRFALLSGSAGLFVFITAFVRRSNQSCVSVERYSSSEYSASGPSASPSPSDTPPS